MNRQQRARLPRPMVTCGPVSRTQMTGDVELGFLPLIMAAVSLFGAIKGAKDKKKQQQRDAAAAAAAAAAQAKADAAAADAAAKQQLELAKVQAANPLGMDKKTLLLVGGGVALVALLALQRR